MSSLGVGDDETTGGGAELRFAAERVSSPAAIALEAVCYRGLTNVQLSVRQNTVSTA